MPRSTNSPASRRRRNRIRAKAKGFMGGRRTMFKKAKIAVNKAMDYAFRDRKQRKRQFRRLWITRISAATRNLGLPYGRFMEGLKKAGVEIDRKILADMAVRDLSTFNKLVDMARQHISVAAH